MLHQLALESDSLVLELLPMVGDRSNDEPCALKIEIQIYSEHLDHLKHDQNEQRTQLGRIPATLDSVIQSLDYMGIPGQNRQCERDERLALD